MIACAKILGKPPELCSRGSACVCSIALPFDVARCAGVGFQDESAPGGIDWREGCEDCRRREPGHPERQAHMSPPAIIAFECAFRIQKGES